MNVLLILESVGAALDVANQLIPQLIGTIQHLRDAVSGKPAGAPLAMSAPQHLELAGSLRIAAGDLVKQAAVLEALA